jgi:hypothetical protein
MTELEKVSRPAFYPTKIVYVPAKPGQAQHLHVTVARHLDLNVRVEELYISQMMRDDRGNPGYYGDGSWRRSQKPDAPELNSREFTAIVSMGPLPVPHNPVPGPPSRQFPVWLDFRWKDAQGRLNGPDSFLLHLFATQ